MEDVVIISGVRTPIGKFQGSLEPLSAPQLGAIAVREAVKRAKVDPPQVDECIMGLVVAAGLGQNPARQAALGGGLANTVGAMTINKVCGSGLKAVALATQAIQTGNAEIVEDSPKDNFWGRGPKWKGANHLGKLWMKIRAELRAAS